MKRFLYALVAFSFMISISSCAGGRRCMGKGINLSENATQKEKKQILKAKDAHQTETQVVTVR